jgi:hypothetical protein
LVYTREVVLSIAIGCCIATMREVCHFYSVTSRVIFGELSVTVLCTLKTIVTCFVSYPQQFLFARLVFVTPMLGPKNGVEQCIIDWHDL